MVGHVVLGRDRKDRMREYEDGKIQERMLCSGSRACPQACPEMKRHVRIAEGAKIGIYICMRFIKVLVLAMQDVTGIHARAEPRAILGKSISQICFHLRIPVS